MYGKRHVHVNGHNILRLPRADDKLKQRDGLVFGMMTIVTHTSGDLFYFREIQLILFNLNIITPDKWCVDMRSRSRPTSREYLRTHVWPGRLPARYRLVTSANGEENHNVVV